MCSVLHKKIENKTIRVCVLGLGYVGFPLLQLVNDKGFSCVGFDVSKKQVQHAVDRGLSASSDSSILKEADVFIICVPTPVDDTHHPDLSAVKDASDLISQYLRKDCLVVLESTVAPGTTDEVVVPLLMQSGLVAGKEFFVAQCPERIDPANTTWDVHNIPRVVGGITTEGTNLAAMFYQSILDAEVMKMSSVTAAEAVKIIENTFRDVNIAFVNELAKSFDALGVDIKEVLLGAATKPFGFLPHRPGCGVGGHCIAIDPYYLIARAEKAGFSHRFLKLAREINDEMPAYTVRKVILGLNQAGLSVNGTRIAILGVAYKPEVDDIRESPAFPIIEQLKQMGAELVVYDPFVPSHSTVSSLDEALAGCACVILITEHIIFQQITAQQLKSARVRVVVDGRNSWNKNAITKAGLIYEGIGR